MPHELSHLESPCVLMTSIWDVSEDFCTKKLLILKSERLFRVLDKAYQEGKITWLDHDGIVEELWLAVEEIDCKLLAIPDKGQSAN